MLTNDFQKMAKNMMDRENETILTAVSLANPRALSSIDGRKGMMPILPEIP